MYSANEKMTWKNELRVASCINVSSPSSVGPRVKEALVSLWDFAGQFVYYATHQLFFSPRCIYLLVLNLDQNLDQTLHDWYFDMRGQQSIEAQGYPLFCLDSNRHLNRIFQIPLTKENVIESATLHKQPNVIYYYKVTYTVNH